MILTYLACFFEVQCSKFAKKKDSGILRYLNEETHKSINKRSVDWSKRISTSSFPEVQGYAAAESEKVEITSKPSRIIRRLIIQHGGNQSVETFKEINPKNRPNGKLSKIVRIKKIRKKTTLEPVITTPEKVITTRNPMIYSSTSIPKITVSSPYAHITVINKETKNPKRKKKNKKKHKYFMISNSPYDNKAQTNLLMDVSRNSKHELDTQFNVHNPHSPYREYNDMHNRSPRLKHQGIYSEEADTNYFSIPRSNDNYKNINTMMSESPRASFRKEKIPQESFHSKMFSMNYKPTSSKFTFIPHENFKNSEINFHSSNKENLKESSSQLKEIITNSDSNSTQTTPKFGDRTKPTTSKPKIKESPSNSSLEIEETTIASLNDEIINKTDIPEAKNETESLPPTTANRAYPSIITVTPQPDRFSLSFPSSLFGEQNAFSDPFFDSPDIPSPRRPVLSWNSPPSPFYRADSSQNGGYFSSMEEEPYHSDILVPRFHQNSQLEFLRRSVLDSSVEETTTSEPVTPFSLPKFEIPPIDFNDKGCRTVYKEVKTVPGDGSQSAVKNEKSFIMTRECYFPNGIPTTEQDEEVKSAEVSATTKPTIVESKA